MFKLSQRSLDNLKGVHPDLVHVIKRAIEETPIDFGIIQGMRTLAYQKELYAQGRTKPGKIVTWTLTSKHLPQKDGYAHAVDIAVYVDGKLTYDESYYPKVAECVLGIAEELGIKIVWGGSWKKKPDWGHFEIVLRTVS